MLGDDYISQHVYQCMTEESRERLYRAYITDALYCISTQKMAMKVKWTDLDKGWSKPKPPAESAEQIISRLTSKINGKEENDEPI